MKEMKWKVKKTNSNLIPFLEYFAYVFQIEALYLVEYEQEILFTLLDCMVS